MASMMNIPVYGIVENFSYFKCPHCGEEHKIFGSGATEAAAIEFDLPILSRIPVDPALAELCDKGNIEDYEGSVLSPAADYIESV